MRPSKSCGDAIELPPAMPSCGSQHGGDDFTKNGVRHLLRAPLGAACRSVVLIVIGQAVPPDCAMAGPLALRDGSAAVFRVKSAVGS